MLATMGMVAFSAAVALIVDAAMNNATPNSWLWLLGIAGVALRLAANLWRDHVAQRVSAHLRSELRQALVLHATALGPHRLAREGNTGWWAQQYLEQVDALHGYLARYLPAQQAATVTPLIIIAITLTVDWIAGLLILLATPIIPIFMVLIGWGTEAVHRTQQAQQATLAAHLMDRLQAMPWLRRMCATGQAKLDVEQAAQDYRKVSMRVLRVAFLSSATLEFFSAVSIGLMAIYIGFALIGLVSFGPADQMTLAAGLFMLMLAPECFMPLRQLAQAHHDMNAAKASAEMLAPLLSNPTPPSDKPNTPNVIQVCPDEKVAAHLADVTLQWPDADEPALKDIVMPVKRGEIIGISGDSGQGKSTLINLLAGFIAPTSGRTCRDSQWAWLGQRPHLFHGSVRENLLLGCETEAPEEIMLAMLAKVGLALPNPLLPEGLERPIGETNAGVSGGQAQRIALARAMLSPATLWLLDEPTAALDADTRDELLDALVAHVREQQITVVMASHDNKALACCDRVMTLQGGQWQASP